MLGRLMKRSVNSMDVQQGLFSFLLGVGMFFGFCFVCYMFGVVFYNDYDDR